MGLLLEGTESRRGMLSQKGGEVAGDARVLGIGQAQFLLGGAGGAARGFRGRERGEKAFQNQSFRVRTGKFR